MGQSEAETTKLSDEEIEVWLGEFVDNVGKPGPNEDAFFERRRQLGFGVGLDTGGDLVREKTTR